MKTKLLQARHLHVGMEIVDGGEGERRTAHRISELSIPAAGKVVATTRNGKGFEHRPYEPRQSVRVKLEEE